MSTLVHAFPTNQSPPVTSIGEPLHENGHTELARMGYLENIANPEPKAPLPHVCAKWLVHCVYRPSSGRPTYKRTLTNGNVTIVSP